MPSPDQLRYAAALKVSAARYLALEDETVHQMVTALKALREQIAVSLSTAQNFNAMHLKTLLAEVDRAIDAFQAQLGLGLRGNFAQVYQAGGDSVIAPLQAAGFRQFFYQPNPAQLNAVMDFSAALVKNITADVRAKIDTQLRLSIMGERTPVDAMRAVTDALGVEARAGVWGLRKRPEVVKGIAARSEAIVRTETTRVHNLATQSQLQAQAQQVPDLLKGWAANGDWRTRYDHLIAHQEYNEHPIPVNESFIVGGEELMYPGDPSASAKQTVNCRCRQFVVHPDVGVIGTPLDKRVQAEMVRREELEAA